MAARGDRQGDREIGGLNNQLQRLESSLAERAADLKKAQAEVRRAETAAKRLKQEVAELRQLLRASKSALESKAAELRVLELDTVLLRGLREPATFDWSAVQRVFEPASLDLGPDAVPTRMPVWAGFESDRRQLRWPRWMRERQEAGKKRRFDQASAQSAEVERLREARVEKRMAEHQESEAARLADVDEHNRRWDAVRDGVPRRDPSSVQALLEVALQLMRPTGFFQEAKAAFVANEEAVTVRVALPPREIVPTLPVHRDGESSPRSAEEIDQLYSSLLGQLILLQLRKLFGADPEINHVHLIGYAGRIDHEGRTPAFIEAKAGRHAFQTIGLSSAPDLARCLQRLGINLPG